YSILVTSLDCEPDHESHLHHTLRTGSHFRLLHRPQHAPSHSILKCDHDTTSGLHTPSVPLDPTIAEGSCADIDTDQCPVTDNRPGPLSSNARESGYSRGFGSGTARSRHRTAPPDAGTPMRRRCH